MPVAAMTEARPLGVPCQQTGCKEEAVLSHVQAWDGATFLFCLEHSVEYQLDLVHAEGEERAGLRDALLAVGVEAAMAHVDAVPVELDEKAILSEAAVMEAARVARGSEIMDPTYACGHCVPTRLNGSVAERNLQYWRSVRYNCPNCPPLAKTRDVEPGHLQGEGKRTSSVHCTMLHPCSYFCYAVRNEMRSLEAMDKERLTQSS